MNVAKPVARESNSCPASIVFVVDDDVSVRESLELLLLSSGLYVETFASAAQFLTRKPTGVPSCLILDMKLPDLNGFELQERVAMDGARVPIIFITGYGNVPMAVRAMKAGAIEFLIKPLLGDALLRAIEEALTRSGDALAEEADRLVLRQRYSSLSGREREVMHLVVGGIPNKLVGSKLGISETTVKAHRGRVMQKMQAESLPELVKFEARLRGSEAPGREREPRTGVRQREAELARQLSQGA